MEAQLNYHTLSHAAAAENLTKLSTGKFHGLNFLPLPVKLFGFSVRSQDICKFVLLLSILVIHCGDVRNESWSFGELCQAARGTTCNPKDPDLKQWHGSSEGRFVGGNAFPGRKSRSWSRLTISDLFSFWHLYKKFCLKNYQSSKRDSKAILSMRRWTFTEFGSEQLITFVAMATPDDLNANAEFIRLADSFVEVPGGCGMMWNDEWCGVGLRYGSSLCMCCFRVMTFLASTVASCSIVAFDSSWWILSESAEVGKTWIQKVPEHRARLGRLLRW